MDSPASGPDSRRNLELRLRAAVESSPSGLLMVDQAGRIVLLNREIERMFGYAREELLGRPVEVLVPERFREAHPADRARFAADPRVRAMGAGRDLYGLRKDGSEVPVEIGLTPVATEEGLFIISSVVDISERRRAEERFRLAVDASPNGQVMVDGNGVIVMVNRETERLFGYARDELLGQRVEILVPERFRGRHPEFFEAFMRDPSQRAMGAGRELYGLRKDGAEIPVEIGLNPIRTGEGWLVLSAVVDISERKRAEAEQRRLEAQLRQAQKMEALGTLAGGIAHDFNNVLGAIVGYAELARAAATDAKAAADLSALLEAAERGRAIIERILTFSRRQEPVRRPADLSAVVHDALKLLRASLPSSIELRAEVPADLPPVLADANGIQQVILNLANNAAQAMPGGGVLGVRLRALYLHDRMVREHPGLREGTHLELTVQDEGAGMEPEVAARAFEPFYTTKPPGRGTGLGLALVDGIVRDHQGAVDLRSAPGEGTTVTCLFPCLGGDGAERAESALGALRKGTERVLLVDDEPALAVVGERMLAALGYEVRAVSSSRKALAELKGDPQAFDVLLTDYSMPQLHGMDLALQAHALRPDLPILLMTGYMEDLPLERLAAAGVRRVLRKPVTLEQFAEGLREVLDGA